MRPGGSGANIAAWLARAGVDVTLIGRVGDDAARPRSRWRRWTASICASASIRERPTGTCIVLVAPGGERTMLPDPGANAALSADELPDDLFAPGASCTSPATR